jgi:glycosyltransferase involved in cell wall biosynthesis
MNKPSLRIAFLHEGKAFLPGIKAYTEYFSRMNAECISVNISEDPIPDADVHWHFMGMHTAKKIPGTYLIHEYASASVPPFRKSKDFFKRLLNTKPDLRVFLNKKVEQQLNFSDNIPCCYRDVGIYPEGRKYDGSTEKQYDFIFTGAVTRDMNFENFLSLFTQGKLRDRNILILGRTEPVFRNKFSSFSNIIFHGPVPQEEVIHYLSQSKVAINFKPDIPPYNFQTSTKLLEYLNFGIPVISNRNQWVENFLQESGASIYLLEEDYSNADFQAISGFPYVFPDMKNYLWERQIEKSGLPEIIRKLIEQKGQSY